MSAGSLNEREQRTAEVLKRLRAEKRLTGADARWLVHEIEQLRAERQVYAEAFRDYAQRCMGQDVDVVSYAKRFVGRRG